MDHGTIDGLIGGGAGFVCLLLGLMGASVKRNLSTLDATLSKMATSLESMNVKVGGYEVTIALLKQQVDGLTKRADELAGKIEAIAANVGWSPRK